MFIRVLSKFQFYIFSQPSPQRTDEVHQEAGKQLSQAWTERLICRLLGEIPSPLRSPEMACTSLEVARRGSLPASQQPPENIFKFPLCCRGDALQARSSEADAGGRAGRPGAFPGLRGARCAGTGAGGRRRALAGPRSGPVPQTFAPVFGRYLAATITQCLRSRVPTKTARDEMWPRCPRKRSRRPAARAGSCRWCRSVGVPLVRRDWTCRSDGRARRRCPGLAHGAAGEA